MSDSVWPHRRQPTRLCCPWDSLGKNTGVGCHFLLQCMKVKSESEVTQSFQTLSNPMASPSGPSVHGIFQARVLEWGAMGFSRLRPLSYVNYTSLKPKWKHFKLNVSIVHKETSWILTLHLSSFYLKGALIKDLSMKSLADVGTSDNSKKDSSLAKEYLCYLHTLDALKEKGRKRMGRRTSNSIWLVIKMQLLE